MHRRTFIRRAALAAALAPLAGTLLPAPSRAAPRAAAMPDRTRDRTLVLVELKGGNDGLDTLIPFRDPDYYRLRPRLAVAKDQVLPLADDQGLHPGLEPLMPLWQAGEMAVIQGLGYPEPNRSHFRSIAIWETGSGSERVLTDGWLRPVLADHSGPWSRASPDVPADALVLGRSSGPVAGTGLRVIHIDRPGTMRTWMRAPARPPVASDSPALAHVLAVEAQSREAAAALARRIEQPIARMDAVPGGRFGRTLALTAAVVAAGLGIPVIKLELNGFDTHTNQAATRRRLLQDLAEGVAAMRKALIDKGAWDRVLVMTYSEFGRRAAENGSGGTDHGTAAPHFLWGGRVKGGLLGEAPSLRRLVGGDLVHTTDYRSLYQTVATGWLGDRDFALPGGRFSVLDCLRT